MKFFRYLPLHRVAILGSLIGVKINSHQCFANHQNLGLGLERPPYLEAIAEAENAIHGQLSKKIASAALLTVYVDGDCVHNSGYGMSDDENKVACHVDNKMKIGNMTMIFTSAQILNYCQKRGIDVNRELGHAVWSGFGQSTFTLKNLLNHCAGLYPVPKPSQVPGISYGHLDARSKAAEILSRRTPMPAGQFMFSCDSYNLAGAYLQSQCILPDSNEMTYPQVFQSMMSDMDLRNTKMIVYKDTITFLTKHYLNIETEAILSDPSKRLASSGLVSNSRDLAKFGDEMLYHEQHRQHKDKRIPFLRNPLTLWAPEKCLHHDLEASRQCAGHATDLEVWHSNVPVDPQGPSTSSGHRSVHCMGYSYGWIVQLVPTLVGDMHKYTIQASSEGFGDSHSGALVVRYGSDRNPFNFCSESERYMNILHNKGLMASKERKGHSTRGIVVALLFNGGNIEAGDIAKKLAQKIDKKRHDTVRGMRG